MPARLSAAEPNSPAVSGRAAQQAAETVQGGRPATFLDQAVDQEQCRLDRDLVGDEQHRGGDPGDGEQAQPEEHVADLADDVEAQDPLHVVLGDRAQDADDHRQPGEPRSAGSIHRRSGTCSVWVRMIAYTPTLVRSPANTAVTATGAVG